MTFKKITIQKVASLTIGVCNVVAIQISKQTHIWNKFGDNESNSFLAKNGITLVSHSYPKVVEENNEIHLWGCETSYNDKLLYLPDFAYDSFLEAVEEYNKHNNADKICEGTCGVTLCDYCKQLGGYLNFAFKEEDTKITTIQDIYPALDEEVENSPYVVSNPFLESLFERRVIEPTQTAYSYSTATVLPDSWRRSR